jgi:hypothetical protein
MKKKVSKAPPAQSAKQNVPAKKYANDEVRRLIQRSHNLKAHPENVLKELGVLMTRMNTMTDKEARQVDSDKNAANTWGAALSIYNLDNHVLLVQSVDDDYRTFAMEFSNQLCEEFGCKTPSEKSMAQAVAGAYIRILEYARQLRRSTTVEYLSKEKTDYYSMMGRELDRANRHYIAALTALKQLKSPRMAVTVKTEAAFIAQNQQINANPPEKQQGEIIDGQ